MELDYIKLLHGQYESEKLHANISPNDAVRDYAYNAINFSSPMYSPIVDNAFLKAGGAKPVWPDKKTFAVCLTHDVDYVTMYSIRQAIRCFRSRIPQNTILWTLLKNIAQFSLEISKAVAQLHNPDPLHCYEKWLEVENEIGARSTFFFWPGWSNIKKHHFTDCGYELYDQVVFDHQRCSVSEMIKEMDCRRWEIGLHSSWYSFDDVDEIKRQKDVLEEVLGHDIVSIRQHYLHYDIRNTPRVHTEAGLKYDSTLGFNDNVGFRFGTSYPWHLYDLVYENQLSIMEIPLIIQDSAMINPKKGMRLDNETALQYVLQLAEAIESVGGVLTLLWHPHAINQLETWKLYKQILGHLKKMNPWFASVQAVGDWYRKQRNLDE